MLFLTFGTAAFPAELAGFNPFPALFALLQPGFLAVRTELADESPQGISFTAAGASAKALEFRMALGAVIGSAHPVTASIRSHGTS